MKILKALGVGLVLGTLAGAARAGDGQVSLICKSVDFGYAQYYTLDYDAGTATFWDGARNVSVAMTATEDEVSWNGVSSLLCKNRDGQYDHRCGLNVKINRNTGDMTEWRESTMPQFTHFTCERKRGKVF